ncbi:MAG: hypothetical protein ABIP38_02000 [Steroidobacteraceae bacterium]
MTTPEPSGKAAGGSTRIVTRDVLAAAWSLFQVCWPACLPLAMVGVAASATPRAEAVASGLTRDFLHSREWWGLCAAATLLVLICYGAVLRQQLQLAAGLRPLLLDSLRRAARDVPYVLLLLLSCAVLFAPAAISTALRGFDAVALLLTVAGCALLVYVFPAWPALIARDLTPWAALGVSIAMVRGRWREYFGVIGILIVAVLVFILLAGILVGMLMGLAGQGAAPTASGLAASRWLMAPVLAAPVVYTTAVAVVLYRAGQPR